MRDIQQVLERWGAWAASSGDSVDYAPIAAGFKGLLPASRRSRTSCSDNDGLIISSAMRVLKQKDAYLCQLLEWYYINGMTLRSLESRLGISRNTVLTRLMTAEGFIDGCLAMTGAVLEMDRYVEKENVCTGLKSSQG